MKRLLLFLLSALFVHMANAQMQVATVHIRVLNGRSGKPVRHAQTFTAMLPASAFSTPIAVKTDAKGVASLLAVSTGELAVTVPHHATCEYKRKSERKTLGPREYPVQQILGAGVVGGDRCGRPRVTAAPGELVVFVRASHWWQRIGY